MLARQLGRTLEELGASMTAAEFFEHWEDYRREPWGVLRNSYEHGRTRQTIIEMSGKSVKESVPLEDCMLKFRDPDAPEEKQSLPPELAHLKQFMK